MSGKNDYFTFICAYCEKVFFSFKLADRDYEWYRKTYIKAGHVIDGYISDDYDGESLDFCNKKCQNRYQDKFFPTEPPANYFNDDADFDDVFDDEDDEYDDEFDGEFDAEFDIEVLEDEDIHFIRNYYTSIYYPLV